MPRLGLLLLSARSGIIWEADFTALTPGAYGGALPGGLSFARAVGGNASETVQTSDTTLVITGMGVDVPRIGQYGSGVSTRGLVLEHVFTQQADDARLWTSGAPNTNTDGAPTTTTNQTPGSGAATADGGTALADRVELTASGQGRRNSGLSVGLFSCWARGWSGSDELSVGYFGGTAVNYSLTTSWRRCDFIGAADATNLYYFNRNSSLTGSANTARDLLLDHRVIASRGSGYLFLGETILNTTSANITRNAERLWHPTIANLLDNGRLSFETKIIPKGAATDYGANMYIWDKDANNFCRISNTTRRVDLTINSVSFSPATALSWNGKDVLELWVEGGGGVLNSNIKYRVNGGATTDLGSSGSAAASIGTGTAINLLCRNTTSLAQQFTSWIQYIRAWKADKRPSWAA